MAFRDGTGPNGKGPMTGRRMGNCNPENDFAGNDSYRGRGLGRGCGMGRRNGGFGYGNRRGQGFANYDNDQAYNNKSQLSSIINYLTDRLTSYQKRLDEIDNDK